ncbi:hypothetical protein [Paenibacillus cremeus]|uniref:Uncharacterized protein n=1 Tax=Paenibacillus cremeus TaxID=2163881 RepID=A0A559KAE1_9BACL|nr:hypothetical protein [Paenibacillus cremeus]TVY09095.1 hypothetical protein FPZ49_15405 [Paenibacillus cremeus]
MIQEDILEGFKIDRIEIFEIHGCFGLNFYCINGFTEYFVVDNSEEIVEFVAGQRSTWTDNIEILVEMSIWEVFRLKFLYSDIQGTQTSTLFTPTRARGGVQRSRSQLVAH